MNTLLLFGGLYLVLGSKKSSGPVVTPPPNTQAPSQADREAALEAAAVKAGSDILSQAIKAAGQVLSNSSSSGSGSTSIVMDGDK